MKSQIAARQLPVTTVARLCRRETQRFQRGEQSDPAYCYELFRRALQAPPHTDRDVAWQAIYTQFHLQLTRAAQQHQLIGVCGLAAETVADQAFSRMFQTFAKNEDKLAQFDTLPTLITFLRLSVHSVIVDRCRQGKRELPLTETQPADAAGLRDLERSQLWAAVYARARDRQEQLVLYGCFELGLAPRLLFDAFPTKFDSVRQIYRINERLLRRLRRDERLRQQLEAYV